MILFILFLAGCLTNFDINLENILEQGMDKGMDKGMVEFEYNEKFSVIIIEIVDYMLAVSKVEYFYNKEPNSATKRTLKEDNYRNLLLEVSLMIFNFPEDYLECLIDSIEMDDELNEQEITECDIPKDSDQEFTYNYEIIINISLDKELSKIKEFLNVYLNKLALNFRTSLVINFLSFLEVKTLMKTTPSYYIIEVDDTVHLVFNSTKETQIVTHSIFLVDLKYLNLVPYVYDVCRYVFKNLISETIPFLKKKEKHSKYIRRVLSSNDLILDKNLKPERLRKFSYQFEEKFQLIKINNRNQILEDLKDQHKGLENCFTENDISNLHIDEIVSVFNKLDDEALVSILIVFLLLKNTSNVENMIEGCFENILFKNVLMNLGVFTPSEEICAETAWLRLSKIDFLGDLFLKELYEDDYKEMRKYLYNLKLFLTFFLLNSKIKFELDEYVQYILPSFYRIFIKEDLLLKEIKNEVFLCILNDIDDSIQELKIKVFFNVLDRFLKKRKVVLS